MKKLMMLIIIAMAGIIMYQGGCFDDFEFYYGAKIIRILDGDG